jgi:hypothetical protein
MLIILFENKTKNVRRLFDQQKVQVDFWSKKHLNFSSFMKFINIDKLKVTIEL